MSRRLNLQLPEPCSESWDAMRPEGNGRHCASCRKIVTDFTTLSDAELIAALRKQPEGCGRFREDQLERPLVIPRKPWPGLRYFFTITLPAFLLSLKASAQISPAKPDTVQTAPQQEIMGRLPRSLPAGNMSGKVLDAQDNPVPFATVRIKGTKYAVSADANGQFEVPEVNQLPILLEISAVGFYTLEATATTTVVNVKLQRLVLGGMSAVVVRVKKPRPFKSLFKPKPAPAPLPPSILIYPNPVSSGNDLTIQGKNLEAGAYHLELYNLAGQLVKKSEASCSAKSDRMTLSTSGVPAGNYIVRVVNEKTGKALSEQVVLR